MRILLTSDLHGDLGGFEKYSALLRTGHFDLGVVAGDLGDYNLTLREIGATPGVAEDDLLEELYDPEDTVEDLERRVQEYRQDPDTPLARAIRHKEDEIRSVLETARKHIVLVAGNHDLSDWASRGRIHNVHDRPFRYKGWNFVSYRYTRLEVSEEEEERQLTAVAGRLTGTTVLVTHSPALGTLDLSHSGRNIGSRPLCQLVQRPEVALHLFGHVHASFGYDRNSANGSYEERRCFIGIGLPRTGRRARERIEFSLIDPHNMALELTA